MQDYLKFLQHEVTEVRILRSERYLSSQDRRGAFTGGTVSGYYNCDAFEKLESDIQSFDNDPGTKGIYTTLHACNPELIARAENRLRMNVGDNESTSDNDILFFSTFQLDIDPKRPSGISSSAQELEVAAKKAGPIAEMFSDLNIPFAKGMSGNGYHLLIPINPLECSEENIEAYKKLGDTVANHFGTDTTIYNPARIWKLYGTLARKGDNTDNRPHRRAFIHLPNTDERLDFQDLHERLLDGQVNSTTTSGPEPTPPQKKKSERYDGPNTSLREWLDQNGVAYTEKPYKDGTKYQMDCPFNPSHKSPDAVCYEGPNGWAFKCSHNSCSDRNWADFKAKVGRFDAARKEGKRRGKAASQQSTYINPPIEENNTSKVFSDDQIDTDTSDTALPDFPMELFTGIFADYRDALHEANPVPDSFIFASLKQCICASLGRAVFIDSDPVVYPIIYTGLIGDSSDGHKGIALTLAGKLLKQADPNVLQMPSLTTEEGFIDMFVDPEPIKEDGEETGEVIGYRDGWYPWVKDKDFADEIIDAQMSHESIRILGRFAEFSQILQRGKKAYTAGMLELMMDLYDAPPVIVSPNKHAKARADYPTFGLIGCSTFNLIESALDTNYIGGGLTNRFEWYHGEAKRSMFIFGKADVDKWSATVEQLHALRERFLSPTSYEMTPEANAMGLEWLKQFEEQIATVAHDFVVDSLKRQKILIMKNALIFSVLRNDGTKIEPKDIQKAIVLSEYTCNVVNKLFANFHNSETKRVVNRIIEVLKRRPRQSKRQIWNQMQWAETRDVEESVDRLVRMGILGAETPNRTELYSVLYSMDENESLLS